MTKTETDVSPEKACKILEDGTINGEPLTEAQRGMFGAICARARKGFKVHRGCVKSLCKDCMERLELEGLLDEVKALRKSFDDDIRSLLKTRYGIDVVTGSDYQTDYITVKPTGGATARAVVDALTKEGFKPKLEGNIVKVPK